MRTLSAGRRPGFSMLELLIVVSMIGLMSLMAFGRTSSMVTQWRVTRASQAFAEELQAAFAIVGRDRRPVMITFDKPSMELRITSRDGTVTYRRRSIGPSSAYGLQPANIINAVAPVPVIVFPPGLAGDTLSVEIRRQGKYRRIRMLRGGLVQICSNPATVNGPCTPA